MKFSLNLKAIGYNIYILLWCMYWLQGSVYSTGGIMSQLILGSVLLFSLFQFIIANFRYRLPSALRTLSLIIVIFITYGIFSILKCETFVIGETGLSGITAVGYLKNIMISLLPIYTIYVAVKEGYITERSIKKWIIPFLLVALAEFYQSYLDGRSLSSLDDITNNSAYVILAILIFLPFLSKKPFIQYLLLIICLLLVLIGMKRGAWVCGLVVTIWFLYNNLRHRDCKRNAFKIVLLSIIILWLTRYAIDYMYQTNDYFNTRLESTLEGDSSHRDEIYSELFYHFTNETSFLNFMFGHGANSTLKIAANYAHNDWLEIAINNGLFMVILYAIFWIQMISLVRYIKNDKQIYMIISMFLIIYFIRTFFSMSYADIPTCASVALGFAMAKIEQKHSV